MADQKISELTALTSADAEGADLIPVVDTSATQTKSMTLTELDKKWGYPVTNYSSAQTLDADESYIVVDTSGGAFQLTLPAASSYAGKRYVISKTPGATDINKCTVSDGTLSTFIMGAGESVEVVSDGTNWRVMGSQPSSIMDWTVSTSDNTICTIRAAKYYFHREICYVTSGLCTFNGAGAASAFSITTPFTIATGDLANGTDTSNAGATHLGPMTTWFDQSAGSWRFIQPKYGSTTTVEFFINTQTLFMNSFASGESVQFPGLIIPVA